MHVLAIALNCRDWPADDSQPAPAYGTLDSRLQPKHESPIRKSGLWRITAVLAHNLIPRLPSDMHLKVKAHKVRCSEGVQKAAMLIRPKEHYGEWKLPIILRAARLLSSPILMSM